MRALTHSHLIILVIRLEKRKWWKKTPQEEDLNEKGFEPRTAKWNCFVALFTQKAKLSDSKAKIFSIVVFSTNGLFLPPSSSTSAKKWFFAAFKVGRRTFKNVTVVILAKKRPAHNFLGDLLKHLSNFFKIVFFAIFVLFSSPWKEPQKAKKCNTHSLSHIHLLSFTLSLFQALTFYLSLLTNSLTLSPKNSHLLALPHSFTLSLPPAHTHSFSVQPSLSLLHQFF